MTVQRRIWWIVGVIMASAVIAGAVYWYNVGHPSVSDPLQPTVPTASQTTDKKPVAIKLSVVATKLDTPWSLAFMPDGDFLVTERSGAVKRIGRSGKVYPVKGVHEAGEGGLLGLALHPAFKKNHFVYVYLMTDNNGQLTNRVDRYKLANDSLQYDTTILKGIPAALYHNGGGIAFGPDKKLYVTTGDATTPDSSQDTRSLAGKILRMNDDGSTPRDNPFGNLVWSYGHRNPQGITWDEQGRLWSVEHGPSGDFNGHGKDELNYIKKGGNYGWPVITGNQTARGMYAPVAQSGNQTWAPSGIAYYDGSLFFAGLRGQTLYEAKILSPKKVSLTRHFTGKYGRLRAVAIHDDVLYFSTSNRDSRGTPATQDDRIFKISPELFDDGRK